MHYVVFEGDLQETAAMLTGVIHIEYMLLHHENPIFSLGSIDEPLHTEMRRDFGQKIVRHSE